MYKTSWGRNFIFLAVLFTTATSAWAYGGGGGTGSSCKKPSFKNMLPAKGSAVEPGAEFSFTASSNTNPKSIKVVIKGQSVPLKVSEKGAIKVTGNLPAQITEGYARINISASSSQKSCTGAGGWLVKIGG